MKINWVNVNILVLYLLFIFLVIFNIKLIDYKSESNLKLKNRINDMKGEVNDVYNVRDVSNTYNSDDVYDRINKTLNKESNDTFNTAKQEFNK